MRFLLTVLFSLTIYITYSQELIPYQVYKLGEENTTQLWGYKNTKHEVVIPPVNEQPQFFNNDFVLIKKGNSYGIMDKKGIFVVPPVYSHIFVGKAYWDITKDKITSFFSTKTREIIEVKDASHTSCDNVFIRKYKLENSVTPGDYTTDTYALINEKGKLLSNKYRRIVDNNEGYFRFSEDGLTEGFMDSTGKVILQPKYWMIKLFNNGQAVVDFERKEGIIDNKGNEIIKPSLSLLQLKNKMYSVKDSNGIYITDFKNTTFGKNMRMTGYLQGDNNFAILSKGSEGNFLINKGNTIHINNGYNSVVSIDGVNYLFIDNYVLYQVVDGKKKALPYDSVQRVMHSKMDKIWLIGSSKGSKYSVIFDKSFKEIFKSSSELVGIDSESGMINTYFTKETSPLRNNIKRMVTQNYTLSFVDDKGKRYSEVRN